MLIQGGGMGPRARGGGVLFLVPISIRDENITFGHRPNDCEPKIELSVIPGQGLSA